MGPVQVAADVVPVPDDRPGGHRVEGPPSRAVGSWADGRWLAVVAAATRTTSAAAAPSRCSTRGRRTGAAACPPAGPEVPLSARASTTSGPTSSAARATVRSAVRQATTASSQTPTRTHDHGLRCRAGTTAAGDAEQRRDGDRGSRRAQRGRGPLGDVLGRLADAQGGGQPVVPDRREQPGEDGRGGEQEEAQVGPPPLAVAPVVQGHPERDDDSERRTEDPVSVRAGPDPRDPDEPPARAAVVRRSQPGPQGQREQDEAGQLRAGAERAGHPDEGDGGADEGLQQGAARAAQASTARATPTTATWCTTTTPASPSTRAARARRTSGPHSCRHPRSGVDRAPVVGRQERPGPQQLLPGAQVPEGVRVAHGPVQRQGRRPGGRPAAAGDDDVEQQHRRAPRGATAPADRGGRTTGGAATAGS